MLCVVSNRSLCKGPLLPRLEAACRGGADILLIREKDLPPAERLCLCRQAIQICSRYGTRLVVNGDLDCARQVGAYGVQLPYAAFLQMERGALPAELAVGVSVHSPEEAARAAAHGADSLLAGHVFATACKKGLAPRGLPFVKQVRERAGEAPVWAIGGITTANGAAVLDSGAAVVCVMSSVMEAADAEGTVRALRAALSSR